MLPQYILIHFISTPSKQDLYRLRRLSLFCSINQRHIHAHTYTHMQASSHHPVHSLLKWELWHFFELKRGICFLLGKLLIGGGEALHCVPATFPVRLTHNEALSHCHIALPPCRSMRNTLKVIITDEQGRRVEGVRGGGEKRGTDIEKLQRNGRQIWIRCDRWRMKWEL